MLEGFNREVVFFKGIVLLCINLVQMYMVTYKIIPFLDETVASAKLRDIPWLIYFTKWLLGGEHI